MKNLHAAWICLVLLLPACSQSSETAAEFAITTDIDNFWQAYDQIVATSDSAAQYMLLDSLFIKPGTPGLRAIMERRGYTATSYIEAILAYPQFWSSVRANTGKAAVYADEINEGVNQLELLYPELKPARVYFTMGALMTNGMTLDDVVFIGSEVAMADSTAITDELPGRLGTNLRAYFDSNPITHIAFLNVHEYVHTQQSAFGSTLLQIALQEGVAEFVAVEATGKPSPTPALAYGKANEPAVRDRFITEMFSPNTNDWLYNNFSNEFGVRDMGYYVGYAIAEAYYAGRSDKDEAIATLIELPYDNMDAVAALVDSSGYFPQPFQALREMYDANQPRVVRVLPFDTDNEAVKAGPTRVSIQFSRPMSPRFRGFDYGPLGEAHVMGIQEVFGWSDDGMTLEVEVNLKPGHRHQMTLTSQFRAPDGASIEPYLIDVTTR